MIEALGRQIYFPVVTVSLERFIKLCGEEDNPQIYDLAF